MLTRYGIYGMTGLIMEILWTGLGSLFAGNFALTGYTYLWMFFIYGLAIFLEPIHDKIRSRHFFIRGIIWVLFIYGIEFLTGFLLDILIGYCPWDYRGYSDYTLYGYVRLDYFPVWFIVGMIFEKFHDFLDNKIIIK